MIKFGKSFLKTTNKSYEKCYIAITRPKLCEDLTKHGIGQNKSKELSIPKTIPNELIKDFVRGYIDGDGMFHIKKNKQLTFGFVSSVYSFAEELKTFLMKNINVSNVLIQTKKGCFECYWGGNLQCKRIFEFLYSNGPWLDRKYNLVSNHFENLKNEIKTINKSKIKNPKIPSELDRILGFG
jgi:hypothetical protein